MPAYLLDLGDGPGRHLPGGHSKFVIFAGTAADARAVAKAAYDGDGGTKFDGATVTEIAVGADLTHADFQLSVNVLDSSPVLELLTTGATGGAISAAVTAGGSGYSANDILTCVGGTFTRAATFRVLTESAGAVATIELVDPGEYTVFPSGALATTVAPSGGSSCTLTPVFSNDHYYNRLAEMVGLLNATSIIAGAALDIGAATPLLTIAAIGDAIGDKKVEAEYRMDGVAIPGFLGAITDEGIAAAVLSVAVIAAPVVPKLYATARS